MRESLTLESSTAVSLASSRVARGTMTAAAAAWQELLRDLGGSPEPWPQSQDLHRAAVARNADELSK